MFQNVLAVIYVLGLVGLVGMIFLLGWVLLQKMRNSRRERQCAVENFKKLKLEGVSLRPMNWYEALKLTKEAWEDDGWRMLTKEEVLIAMGSKDYLSKFRKGYYWTSEGESVFFPTKEVSEKGLVPSAWLYLVQESNG